MDQPSRYPGSLASLRLSAAEVFDWPAVRVNETENGDGAGVPLALSISISIGRLFFLILPALVTFTILVFA
jgi:hypothetical protein